MARPGSIIKAGYYPIPPYITSMIAKHIEAPNGGRLLDPCAGEAVALCQLAELLNLEPYGSELHKYRAQTAHENVTALLDRHAWYQELPHKDKGLTRMLNDDFQNIQTSKGAMQLVYLNPPYDTDDKDKRLEYTFLKRSNWWLQPKGILILVVPQHTIGHKNIATYLSQWYDQPMVYGFPEPDFEDFKQIVFIGRRLEKQRANAELKRKFELVSTIPFKHLVMLPDKPQIWTVPAPQHKTITYRGLFPNEEDAAKEHAIYGARQQPQYKELFQPIELGQQQPIMPFKIGHTAQMITAGGLNNELLKDEEKGNILIKGRTAKAFITSTSEEENDEGQVVITKKYRTEYPLPQITIMDDQGKVTTIPTKNIAPFLNEWLPNLTSAITKHYTPLYNFQIPKELRQHWAFKNGTAIMAQKHAVTALIQHYKKSDAAILQGEMGTGKTRMAAFAAAIMDVRRTLIMVPPHLVKKWIRECQIVMPEANIIQVDTIKDIDNWMALDENKQRQIAVIKFTSARAASGWVPAVPNHNPLNKKEIARIQKKLKRKPKDELIDQYLTPEEQKLLKQYNKWQQREEERGLLDSHMGAPLKDHKGFLIPKSQVLKSKKKQYYHTTKGGRFAHPNGGITKQRQRWVAFFRYKRHTDNATTYKAFAKRQEKYKAGQQVKWPRPTSSGRARIADYIMKRHPKRVGLFIVDEAHETKAVASDQGYAMARLAKASVKNLLLTGTLYGGKASTVFYLLYRTNKHIRRAYTDTAATGTSRIMVQKWVDDFGMYEYTETTKAASVSTSGNKQTTEYVKEAPGSSPAMLPWLLSNTIFISLADLGTELPDYEEIPMPIQMTEHQKQQLITIENKIAKEMRERLAKGDRSLLSVYLMNSLHNLDAGWRHHTVIDPKTKKEPVPRILAELPPIPGPYPKEEAILDLAKSEVAQGRNVLLLVEQTKTRDITPEWEEKLKAVGLKPKTLKADPDNREAWIDRVVKQGYNVLMTHCRSVSVGLDLFEFPTIIWMAPNYSIYSVLQASRRSYRIGQQKEIKVYFFYYEDSMQEPAIQLTAEKAAAVLRVNGDSIQLDSLAASAGNNIEDALTRMIESDTEMQIGSVTELFKEAAKEAKKSAEYIGGYGSIYEQEEDEDPSDDIIVTVTPAENSSPSQEIELEPEQEPDSIEVETENKDEAKVVIQYHDEKGEVYREKRDGKEITKARIIFGVTKIESKTKRRKKEGKKPKAAVQKSLFENLLK